MVEEVEVLVHQVDANQTEDYKIQNEERKHDDVVSRHEMMVALAKMYNNESRNTACAETKHTTIIAHDM